MKRTVTVILIAVFLICLTSALAAGTAGTASDPLISLSYLNETFLPSARSDGAKAIDNALNAAAEEAAARAAAVTDDALLRLGGPDGYTLLPGFRTVSMTSGASVYLVTGGSIVPVSGKITVTLERGALVDVSTGAEVASGTALTAGHRYLCAEMTKASFTAAGAAVATVDGYVRTGAGATVQDGSAVAPPLVVMPTKQTIIFNGKNIVMEIYNIADSNYFKLRDIAQMMNGTASQFSVEFDLASFTVSAETGRAYVSVGGEMTTGEDKSKSCVVSAWAFKVDNVPRPADAYNLGGNNFFKLRDLGEALDFTVSYDFPTNTVYIFSSDYKG